MMILRLAFVSVLLSGFAGATDLAAITDSTNYNVGDEVRIRLQPAANASASIHYAGEKEPLASSIPVAGSAYQILWKIPSNARTGRYLVDLTASGGRAIPLATSFAVHRQLVKVLSVDLDKTFYTNGDPIDPRIVVKNLSDRPLDDIQVEFEPYNYPWIAPEPGEPAPWKYIVARDLHLAPAEEREFRVRQATVAQVAKGQPEALYYSVVIRNSRDPDRIYDLAFALPAFTVPPNTSFPKQYPFLYLYWHLNEAPKSESYRNFYPPQFVSDVIRFDTAHTMFPAEAAATLRFTAKAADGPGWQDAHLRARVLDAKGGLLQDEFLNEKVDGPHTWSAKPMQPGLYTLQISIEAKDGVTLARNQLEFALDKLPKSLLIFCAHSDDDTAHPALIRAAVENNIPIHLVYLTGSDSGGCDRFYMHSCDAARALDFGEVRTAEAIASLGHLGVPPGNISFLGLPDGGLEQIWYHHKNEQNPYLSVLLASDHSPFKGAAIPNLAYAREPIVQALKAYIERLKPEMIVTGHPDERHVDHRGNNWLVVEAMQQLLSEGKISRDTQLLVDVSYGARPGRHAPYQFEKATFYASGEAAKLGQEALWYFQSQDGNHQQAEIKQFLDLPRTEAWPHFRILDWWEHAGWNEQRASPRSSPSN